MPHLYHDGFQAVFSLHKDTKTRHIHIVRNTVSFKNGKRFHQGPPQLKKLKERCNIILDEYNLDLIKISENEMQDKGIYSFDNGYDFLEIMNDAAEKRIAVIVDASDDIEFNNGGYNPDYPTAFSNTAFYRPRRMYNMFNNSNHYAIPAQSQSAWQSPQTMPIQSDNSQLSIPSMVIDNSRNCELIVDTPEAMAALMGQVGNIPSMSFQETSRNVNIGEEVMNRFQQNNVFANVVVDNSTNVTIKLDSSTGFPNAIDTTFNEKK